MECWRKCQIECLSDGVPHRMLAGMSDRRLMSNVDCLGTKNQVIKETIQQPTCIKKTALGDSNTANMEFCCKHQKLTQDLYVTTSIRKEMCFEKKKNKSNKNKIKQTRIKQNAKNKQHCKQKIQIFWSSICSKLANVEASFLDAVQQVFFLASAKVNGGPN